MVKSLALEVAPVRVNLITAGFSDTPELASLPGDQINERRMQPPAVPATDRVIAPADIAALAIHLMTNTAITGATIDIIGGQQLTKF
jgi:NAD(P)-dependent dehydrogenase (short-subunit alcohol dehydrogenase family)